MENSIGLKRVNIYTSLPCKVNPFSNIEIHCMTIPDFQFSFFGSCCLKFTSGWGRHVLKKSQEFDWSKSMATRGLLSLSYVFVEETFIFFLSCISLFRIALILHITNIIPIETSYSTLPNKSFAQVIKMNLYVSKLFRNEISDEKRPSQ